MAEVRTRSLTTTAVVSTGGSQGVVVSNRPDNYSHIKSRYFQSLNLSKTKGQEDANNARLSKLKLQQNHNPSSSASQPIPTPNRKRSITQPLNVRKPGEDKSIDSHNNTNNQPSDYFVPFAMSVPTSVILGSSFAPYGASIMSRPSLDQRPTGAYSDEQFFDDDIDSDDDYFDSREISQPILIPSQANKYIEDDEAAKRTLTARPVLEDNYVEQRRKNAKIRSLVAAE